MTFLNLTRNSLTLLLRLIIKQFKWRFYILVVTKEYQRKNILQPYFSLLHPLALLTAGERSCPAAVNAHRILVQIYEYHRFLSSFCIYLFIQNNSQRLPITGNVITILTNEGRSKLINIDSDSSVSIVYEKQFCFVVCSYKTKNSFNLSNTDTRFARCLRFTSSGV